MLKKTYKTDRLFLVQPNINIASEITDFYFRNKDFFKDFDPLRRQATPTAGNRPCRPQRIRHRAPAAIPAHRQQSLPKHGSVVCRLAVAKTRLQKLAARRAYRQISCRRSFVADPLLD